MLSLTDFEESHFPELLSWFPDEAALIQWAGPALEFPLSAAKLSEMLAESQTDPPTRLCWTVTAEGAVAGHAQLVLDRKNGAGRIARVVLAPGFRGKGLALPLVKSVIDRSFAIPWIERLELNVYTFNRPAIRTYERAGFVTDESSRSSKRVGDEVWEMVMMRLPRSRWEA